MTNTEQKKEYKLKPHHKKTEIETSDEQKQLLSKVCRDFMKSKCERETCRFIHDSRLCQNFWKTGRCKYKDGCRKKHFVTVNNNSDNNSNNSNNSDNNSNNSNNNNNNNNYNNDHINNNSDNHDKNEKNNYKNKNENNKNQKRQKNTVCFEPMTRPVDLRVVMDLGLNKLSTTLTSSDVLLVPKLFKEFKENEIYNRLVEEIESSKVPKDQLLKLWHGNETIPGTHLICNDKTPWKRDCPTFNMVVQRLIDFFEMDVKATRLNWYTDTSQWKAFHKDAASIRPEKAATQNFTVAVSFGISRDCAFERDSRDQTVISFPVGDGEVYCFTNDTNMLWRHGVLQELPIKQQGRISIICWGWIDKITKINY